MKIHMYLSTKYTLKSIQGTRSNISLFWNDIFFNLMQITKKKTKTKSISYKYLYKWEIWSFLHSEVSLNTSHNLSCYYHVPPCLLLGKHFAELLFLLYSSFDMTNRGGISKKKYLEDKIDTGRKTNWLVEYL